MLKNTNWHFILAIIIILISLVAMITVAMLISNSDWTAWQKIAMMFLVFQ